MKKIGLITYHSAYNFGSVLQAYATQEIVKNIAGNCEIINYRMLEQKKIYATFRWDQGLKSLFKNIAILPQYSQKKNREKKYENFFLKYFNMSEELSNPGSVAKMWMKYDIIVAGSDQIWNKHSNELENCNWSAMDPYLLKGYKGDKISYASSITSMTDVELNQIAPDLKDYNYISSRESYNVSQMEKVIGKKVTWVVDPTFLIKKDEWIDRFHLKHQDEKYILYYSLLGWKDVLQEKKNIEMLAKKKGLKVKMLLPLSFLYKSNNFVEILSDVGPIEFLNLIYNATTVITDSYHGTILSVNFGKDIYSICPPEPSHRRKVDALEFLGLQDRIINSTDDILSRQYAPINYQDVYAKLDKRRLESLHYLQLALA